LGRQADALEYLSRVSGVLACYRFEGLELPTHDSVAVGMFARAGGLLISGALLIEHHHAEEALAIGRALFTESLWLMTLDDAGTDRTAYELQWSMDSETSRIRLVYEGAKVGAWGKEQANEYLAALKRQQHEIQAYQRRHEIPRLLKFGDVGSMAKRLGREAELLPYLMSHHMVHGSDVAHQSRREFDPETEVYRVAM
jgi:hypothetical protein